VYHKKEIYRYYKRIEGGDYIMGRKNSSAKAKQLTDFSHLIEKKDKNEDIVKKENEG